jgi:PAS domain S-box-containing protein
MPDTVVLHGFDLAGLMLQGLAKTSTPMIVTNISTNPDEIRLIGVNSAYCRLLGYSAKELAGSMAKILAGPETDLEAWAENGRKLQAGEQSLRGDGYLYKKNGDKLHVAWSAVPIDPDENGISQYCFSLLRVIHE